MWHGQAYLERRQLFLRSYRFSRKQSTAEKIRRSAGRFRRVVSLGFRAVRRGRRIVWSGLRRRVSCCGRRSGFRRLSRRVHLRGFGDGLGCYSAARGWFGTPCHSAWAGKKTWWRRDLLVD